jgi:hypothetical protein
MCIMGCGKKIFRNTPLVNNPVYCACQSLEGLGQIFRYSPTETPVEFNFDCKFMFDTGKIEFYAAAIILPINANEGRRFGIRNASFRQGCYR